MNSIVQTEVFVALDAAKCQSMVNQFLAKVGSDTVRDVKFQMASVSDSGDMQYSALVIYEKTLKEG